MEALQDDALQLEKVLLQKGAAGEVIAEIRKSASIAKVPVQFVPKEKLDREVGRVNHQGVVALAGEIAYTDFYDIIGALPQDRDELLRAAPILIYLDRITDPHNFGAIIRSAAALGASGVIIPVQESAPLNAATMKASAGAALRMPVARVSNPGAIFDELKERGFWVVGAAGDAKLTVDEVDFSRPVVLVMGSESKGIRDGLRNRCDYLARIPMSADVESLNVSVAASIFLFSAGRRR